MERLAIFKKSEHCIFVGGDHLIIFGKQA